VSDVGPISDWTDNQIASDTYACSPQFRAQIQHSEARHRLEVVTRRRSVGYNIASEAEQEIVRVKMTAKIEII
jgi:hypothetical protein